MKNYWFEWGLGAAAAALMGTGLVVAGVNSRTSEASITPNTATNTVNPRLFLASLTSTDQLVTASRETKHTSIERNETLSAVLDRLGAPRDQANGAVFAAAQFMNLTKVRPGDDVTAWMETDPTSGAVKLTGVSLRPEAERQVLVSRGLDGGWVTHELKARMTEGIHRVAGSIDQSIYQAATALGAGDQQVVDYAEVFGYDIDFQREVQPGDKFEMVYETWDDERGEPVKTGNLLYAEMDGRALHKSFYRFTPSDDGTVDYFDETGQSAKKFLMKTPINGARLSSGFGNRMHPILGYTKLHKGTDFAAPTGTPIYAAGNGVIKRYGVFSDYGNYALISHSNGYETAYGHMSRYAAGLHVGSRVHQGEIIGYVGMTGGATGPHLHYEVHVNTVPVNAMALKLPTGRKLEGVQLAAFEAEKARIDAIRANKQSENLALVANVEKMQPQGPKATPIAATAAPDVRPGSTAN